MSTSLTTYRILAEQVLRDCPRVRILATSREPLGVVGEHVLEVPPLDASSAVQLFAERARAVDRTFTMTADDAVTVGQICRRLDGLPLGIELGAARVRALPLDEISHQLEQGLQLLVAPRSGRHGSLEETIGWSYELLCQPHRATLRRLSTFAGSFTLDTAARLCPQPEVAVRLVADLTERSLLSAVGHGRYRMLDTVRAFASARLVEAHERDAAHLAHATAFTELVEALAARMHTRDEGDTIRRLEAELDNLRAAHAWACSNGPGRPGAAAAVRAAVVRVLDDVRRGLRVGRQGRPDLRLERSPPAQRGDRAGRGGRVVPRCRRRGTARPPCDGDRPSHRPRRFGAGRVRTDPQDTAPG